MYLQSPSLTGALHIDFGVNIFNRTHLQAHYISSIALSHVFIVSAATNLCKRNSSEQTPHISSIALSHVFIVSAVTNLCKRNSSEQTPQVIKSQVYRHHTRKISEIGHHTTTDVTTDVRTPHNYRCHNRWKTYISGVQTPHTLDLSDKDTTETPYT